MKILEVVLFSTLRVTTQIAFFTENILRIAALINVKNIFKKKKKCLNEPIKNKHRRKFNNFIA